MRAGVGVALIGIGLGLGLLVAFGLWRRLGARTVDLTLAALGMIIGAGTLLLQDDPRPADWVVALGLLAVLTPAHCRFVLGPPGGSV